MTQEDLAAKTDVSARTIQRIENDEVEARAYTLQNIANALELEFEALNKLSNAVLDHTAKSNSDAQLWLPLLHLSGLFNLLLPPMIIWLTKRDSVKHMREHGIAVLNFQLSMLLYEVICALFMFFLIPTMMFVPFMLLVLLVLFSFGAVLVNTLKVSNGQPYKYPLSISILKFNSVDLA